MFIISDDNKLSNFFYYCQFTQSGKSSYRKKTGFSHFRIFNF